MTQYVFANNVNTTLATAASNSATTLTLGSSANLPTLSAGQILPLTLNDAATGAVYEIVYVTAISGATLTVTRAQEGTGAQNWSVGDYAFSTGTAGTTAASSGNPLDTFQVAAATAAAHAVNLGQFLGPVTNGATLGSLAISSTYTKTVSFTAPAAGFVWGQARSVISGVASSNITTSLLINGTSYQVDQTIMPMTDCGTVQVTQGEAMTITAQLVTGSASPGVAASLYVDAIFIPSLTN